jgi:hypothetical protein
VLISTLSSSGIFFKTTDGKYYFKEKEAIDYVLKVTEKTITKKMSKEKSGKVLSSTTNKSKKRKNSLSGELNYKLCKIYNIIDNLFLECREKIDIQLKSPYKVINVYSGY